MAEANEVEVEVKTRLTGLRWLYEEREELAKAHQAARIGLIPREVWDQLAAVDDEFNRKMAAIEASIVEDEADIKAGVLRIGKTVKDPFLQVVYTPGRVTWDSKFLDGYAAAHPEVMVARKVGQPSAAIRKLTPKPEG